MRRFIQMLLLILAITSLVFFLLQFTGDPADLLLPEDATQADVDAFRERMGLNDPLYVQYGRFLFRAISATRTTTASRRSGW